MLFLSRAKILFLFLYYSYLAKNTIILLLFHRLVSTNFSTANAVALNTHMQHNVFRNVEHESRTGPQSNRSAQMLKQSRFLRVASYYFSFFYIVLFYFYSLLKSKINFQYSRENIKK